VNPGAKFSIWIFKIKFLLLQGVV